MAGQRIRTVEKRAFIAYKAMPALLKLFLGFTPENVANIINVSDYLSFTLQLMVFFGIGAWGNNNTVGWAWDITNFVFWIGIGHAGTLISAILFLFRQRWRTSVNRAAEAMTIFAVMCAGIFPVIHTGRPWFAYWMFPYPNSRGSLWVNFRSPLMWDVFAVNTYFTVSALFWFVGLIPDLATLRNYVKSDIAKKIAAELEITFANAYYYVTRVFSK